MPLPPRRKRKHGPANPDETSEGVVQPNSKASSKKPAKKRVRGKLSALIDLPIDVLFEVFGHLKPYDLLRLARVTKQFRRLLMNKSSVSVWKAALDRIPDLPSCPPEMSEPAWVNLVFDSHCHFCFTTNIRTVEWEMCLRICSKCVKDQIDDEHTSYIPTIPTTRLPFPLWTLLPSREGRRRTGVLVSEQIKLENEYKAIKDNVDARAQFIRERQGHLKSIREHAEKCKKWAQGQSQDRSDELEELKRERQKAIEAKLEDLGYSQELKFFAPHEFSNQELVKKPQKLTQRVWENIKDQMIAFMEAVRSKRLHVEFNKAICQRKEIAIKMFCAWKNARLPHVDVMPQGLDFCEFSPVKEILEQATEIAVDESSFSDIVPLIPGLITEWRQGLDKQLAELLKKFLTFKHGPSTTPQPSNDDSGDREGSRAPISEVYLLSQAKLAKTVYRCVECVGSCRASGYGSDFPSPSPWMDFGYHSDCSEDSIGYGYEAEFSLDGPTGLGHVDYEPGFITDELLDYGLSDDSIGLDLLSYLKSSVNGVARTPTMHFYPQVLGHHCLVRSCSMWHRNIDPSLSFNQFCEQRAVLPTSRLVIDVELGQSAERLINLSGLDPETATAEDMDKLDIWFACLTCSTSVKKDWFDTTVYMWRDTLEHVSKRHKYSKPAWKEFTSADVEFGRLKYQSSLRGTEGTTSANTDLGNSSERPIWLCTHCMDTSTEIAPQSIERIIVHIKHKHEIMVPLLDIDYYKDFAASSSLPQPQRVIIKIRNEDDRPAVVLD